MIFAFRARVILTTFALILLIPCAGIPLQTRADLETFHNQTLPAWPPIMSFFRSPQSYFVAARSWLAYRVYPIVQASIMQKNILFFVFDTPPQRRITMGADGFIFLNGTDDGHLNNIFEMVCLQAHNPAVVASFRAALPRLAATSRHIGLPIDVEVVPTPETLYGDFIPASVPEKYRRACAARAAGKSPLMEIDSPASLNYVFPFAEMHAARDDPAFYPKGNWHPAGLSLKVIRDVYLRTLGVDGAIDETLELGSGPAELLKGFGIYHDLPIYRIIDQHVIKDIEGDAALHLVVADLFNHTHFITNAYLNEHAIDQESLLIISDSYGDWASGVFAGAFKSVLQIIAGDLRPGAQAELISRIRKLSPVDRVLLLVEEVNTGFIVQYADALDQAASNAEMH